MKLPEPNYIKHGCSSSSTPTSIQSAHIHLLCLQPLQPLGPEKQHRQEEHLHRQQEQQDLHRQQEQQDLHRQQELRDEELKPVLLEHLLIMCPSSVRRMCNRGIRGHIMSARLRESYGRDKNQGPTEGDGPKEVMPDGPRLDSPQGGPPPEPSTNLPPKSLSLYIHIIYTVFILY